MPDRRALSPSLLPFQQRDFRRIWGASLFSNLAQQVQAVTAAWVMVQLSAGPSMVSLVQTVTMLPILLFALPGGAIADMFDRRIAALAALAFTVGGAALLAGIAISGVMTPAILLACCFLVGSGLAIFVPVWQSSIGELVGREALPSAVALYALSANAARSVGPAIGGLIVGTLGAMAAFILNVLLYVPIVVALVLWKRVRDPSRLPPEGVHRAVWTGLRYVRYSQPIRRALLRSLVTAFGGSVVYALLPIVAHDLLKGGPGTYGLLLGSFGIGAVVAALLIVQLRQKFAPNHVITVCSVAHGSAIIVVGASPMLSLSMLALAVAGASWMVMIAFYNVGIQTSASRWVVGRAVATFQATVAGGLALGAAAWGHFATTYSVVSAMEAAGALLILSAFLRFYAPIPHDEPADQSSVPAQAMPQIGLDISGTSGPLIIEVKYRIAPDQARRFYHLSLQVQRMRERNGAYGYSLARDITDPAIWTERFHFPTWDDYRRARERPTQAERDLQKAIQDLHVGDEPLFISRSLERPFGSVRWQEGTPDRAGSIIDLSSNAL